MTGEFLVKTTGDALTVTREEYTGGGYKEGLYRGKSQEVSLNKEKQEV
jgi:hypothetical protein